MTFWGCYAAKCNYANAKCNYANAKCNINAKCNKIDAKCNKSVNTIKNAKCNDAKTVIEFLSYKLKCLRLILALGKTVIEHM